MKTFLFIKLSQNVKKYRVHNKQTIVSSAHHPFISQPDCSEIGRDSKFAAYQHNFEA